MTTITRQSLALLRAKESKNFLCHENMLRLLIHAQALRFIAGDRAPKESRKIIAEGIQYYMEHEKRILQSKAQYEISKPYDQPARITALKGPLHEG